MGGLLNGADWGMMEPSGATSTAVPWGASSVEQVGSQWRPTGPTPEPSGGSFIGAGSSSNCDAPEKENARSVPRSVQESSGELRRAARVPEEERSRRKTFTIVPRIARESSGEPSKAPE
eukprot:2699411-Alexandrium_andersonii.AAC.1